MLFVIAQYERPASSIAEKRTTHFVIHIPDSSHTHGYEVAQEHTASEQLAPTPIGRPARC